LRRPGLPAASGTVESPTGALLQRQPCALAFPGVGRRVGDLAEQRRELLRLPTGERELRERRVVIGGVNEFRPPVLADSDARLGALVATAADALPCRDVFSHSLTP